VQPISLQRICIKMIYRAVEYDRLCPELYAMPSLSALSLAPNVIDWLANSRHPHILHVFDHACNLINERREVLSVVTARIGDGPFNLVIEEDVLFSDHLDVRSLISAHVDQLRLDDLVICIVDANLWNPRPDWERLHGNRESLLNQLTNLQISDYIKRNGFPQSVPTTQSLISNLYTAISAIDISSARAIASQLAGLGVGLTPAGDDCLLGAIYAAWIMHPIETATVLAREIAETAAPLTTSLSAAWLRSAGRGEAGALWHDFFDALFLDDPGAVQLQINRLLSIGHTSGADALAGFIGTFLSYAEAEAKLCHS
jgi:Protein of unknown function (DUF2877)